MGARRKRIETTRDRAKVLGSRVVDSDDGCSDNPSHRCEIWFESTQTADSRKRETPETHRSRLQAKSPPASEAIMDDGAVGHHPGGKPPLQAGGACLRPATAMPPGPGRGVRSGVPRMVRRCAPRLLLLSSVLGCFGWTAGQTLSKTDSLFTDVTGSITNISAVTQRFSRAPLD